MQKMASVFSFMRLLVFLYRKQIREYFYLGLNPDGVKSLEVVEAVWNQRMEQKKAISFHLKVTLNLNLTFKIPCVGI